MTTFAIDALARELARALVPGQALHLRDVEGVSWTLTRLGTEVRVTKGKETAR